ncbi:hypothetical protein SIN01_23360 [Sporolactobacillus inulinus]|nr:hypothetical protein SIN01_23360 [Sporolactobacillus inulinus]
MKILFKLKLLARTRLKLESLKNYYKFGEVKFQKYSKIKCYIRRIIRKWYVFGRRTYPYFEGDHQNRPLVPKNRPGG